MTKNMETGKKTVAVVVPCYGYAHYLEECIDSVVNQTYKVDEIIIVNDGSKDNTSEVAMTLIAKYPDSNIILVEKENGGLSSARNAGIKIVQSEWISCLDADDKLVPGGIEEHMRLITDDLSICQAALMEFGERHVIAVPTTPTGLERILKGNTIFCNALFSKRVWEAVGGFDESQVMRWGYEDWAFWIACLEYGCHVNTSDFIALRYRCHEGQMTQATSHPHMQELFNYIYRKYKHLYDEYGTTISGMILDKNENL